MTAELNKSVNSHLTACQCRQICCIRRSDGQFSFKKKILKENKMLKTGNARRSRRRGEKRREERETESECNLST